MSKYDYLFKIVIVGDHNCGKSCILLRFAENKFREDHITTIGVDFKLKSIKLDKDRIRLELWDTGMERYRTIYNSYYHSAHGVMCVYDIADKRSFENIKNYWINEVRRHAPQQAVLMLVGNKADVEKRAVDFDCAEKFASDMGISLFEVSAKSAINIDDAFMELATTMRERVMMARTALITSPLNRFSGYVIDDADEINSGFHVDGIIRNRIEGSQCCLVPKTVTAL